MSVAFPQLSVGEPTRHESLSLFPLFAEPAGDLNYRLSDEALADESVLVEEISEGGSVPDLLVENKGDARVLFLEGEELIGAKQNRILNTSVLVAAHSKLKIPVSCVERGRWRYNRKSFGSSGSHSSSKLRHALKASVSNSVREKRGHRSDQGKVWKEVDSMCADFSVASDTAAMSDVYSSYTDRIQGFQENLNYVDGAVGVAAAIGNTVVSIDIFDKPATCEKVWKRLLTGLVFDALAAEKTEDLASVSDVEKLLDAAGGLSWEPAKAVGEGEEYRAESPSGDHASALEYQGTLVHGSVLTAV
jgi:hypothetical protein